MQMVRTTRLKIWTLVCHALILIGLGHGILTLGIADIFWLLSVIDNTQELGDAYGFIFRLVGLLSLMGQIAIITSIFWKHMIAGKLLQIAGLCLLWTSVIEYAYSLRDDRYAHISFLSCLPFAYCTIRTLLYGSFRLLWQKIEAKI
jgi:hypothetical protein